MTRLLAALATGVALAAHAADPAAPAFRLGDLATPKGYEARIAASPREDGFAGEIRIALTFNRASPVLWLNATGLEIDSARIAQGGREVEARVIPAGEDFVGFASPGEPFQPGDAVATLRYHGKIDNVASRGLFRKRYEDLPYLYTQFEAIDARRAFPCFDEPGWKTPWRLTIDAPADDVVVSNTPELSAMETPGRAGWRRHEFKATPPLPTYLVALAIGPFDVVDGGTAGARKTPLRYIVPRGHGPETRQARADTPRVLEILEDYFGIPYPFDKLDTVAMPQFGGAMENAGMITYDVFYVVARPHEETDDTRRRYAGIAAHEIAHQWFGDYMTLAWWDDIWLNEAFATWMARKVVYRLNPEWDDGYDGSWSRRRAVESDRLASARRVRNPITDKGDIRSAFDGITYNKGAEVLAMFEAGIGPERFREGVALFLRRHALASATSSDFFHAIAEASGAAGGTMKAFESFVEQPGVPRVEARLRCEGDRGVLELGQKRLRPAGSHAADMHWSIPACFRYPGADGLRSQCATIAGEAAKVSLEGSSCPKWVVGNARGVGHYVMRYDADLARAIARSFGEVPAHEAIALLGDAELLSESGIDRIEAALDWSEAGLAHPSPFVQAAAVKLLDAQQDAWLDGAQARRKAEILARRVVPLAAKLGWKARAGEGRGAMRVRQYLMPVAAKAEAGAALRPEARELALAWIADRKAIDADTAQAVLDTAARFADEAMLGSLREALRTSPSRADQRTLLKAIAKVRDPRLRAQALGLALDRAGGSDVLDGHDTVEMLSFALEDEGSRPAAFQYVRAHFEPLVAKAPRDSPVSLVKGMAQLCTARERAQFADFFAARAARFVGGEVAYRQSLEAIDLCVAARAL